MGIGTMGCPGRVGLVPGARAFSPASLFVSNEPGFWADVTPSRLWQDTARTQPVTAAGQLVRSWALSTGQQDVYATQAGVSGLCPIYQIDSDGRPFLSFDGIDDFLTTPSINFTASNEMTIIAGVRKITDAGLGVVAELTASTSANNGAFVLAAPSGAGLATYVFTSKGTLAVGRTATGYAAPHSAVLVATAKISTDTCNLQVNGADLSNAGSDQGSGNYANAAVFIGRRGGSSSPFNGRLYGLIVRGALTNVQQQASARAWMNSRTGAY